MSDEYDAVQAGPQPQPVDLPAQHLERPALEARAKDGRVGVRDISDKQKRTFVLFILSHSCY